MMPSDPASVQYGSMIPQLTTHMSALQLGTTGSVSIPNVFPLNRLTACATGMVKHIVAYSVYIAGPHPYPFYPGPGASIIHTLPMPESEQTSNAASPDDSYQAYQAAQQPSKYN
ncbi:hypothetical protein J437_LFUL009430 [Ladona fulva]|uniref:Uncharacterized protein n=1 Tax=Ladona fulva TaxID=123851 RepID=A0A8K0JY92_LADFU|nr:hypothetical protein J437_LFUL009430 [Ladona fulva]